jgi:D-3-phosphoglycerate dehydrogenase
MGDYKIVLYNTEGIGTSVEEKVLSDRGLESFKLIRISGNKDEEFLREAADADGVSIVYFNMDETAMAKLTRCRVIAAQCIGVNNIDLDAATRRGIYVTNVPDYCIEEVAVHTLGLVLDCVRKITQLDRSVQAGIWDFESAGKIYRTKEKTYGLVSFGSIARRVAELLKPFGMKILAYDPYVSDEVFKMTGVEREESLEGLFAHCDYISVHTPLSPQTRHMIGKAQLQQIKSGAVLVCTGRGGVIDEAALKESLLSGTIAAAAMDVIEDETQYTSELIGLKNVIITPHAAYYSEEALDEVRTKAMEQVVSVLVDNKVPGYLVNMGVVD